MKDKISVRLTADSIQSLDDVKMWARRYEARTESRLDQEEAATALHKKLIARNFRWLFFSVGLFGSVLAVIVGMFGIPLIFGF